MSVITPLLLESPEVRGMASNERKVIGWELLLLRSIANLARQSTLIEDGMSQQQLLAPLSVGVLAGSFIRVAHRARAANPVLSIPHRR